MLELYLQQVRDRVRPAVIAGSIVCNEVDYCVGVLYLAAYMTGNQSFYEGVQDLYSLSRISHHANYTYQEGIPDLACLNDIVKHVWRRPSEENEQLYSLALARIDQTLYGAIDSYLTPEALSRLHSAVGSDKELIICLRHYQVFHKVRFGAFPDTLKSCVRYTPYVPDKDRDAELLDNLYRLGVVFLSGGQFEQQSCVLSVAIARAYYGDKGKLMQLLSSVRFTTRRGSRTMQLVPGFDDAKAFGNAIHSCLDYRPHLVSFICGSDHAGILGQQLKSFPEYKAAYVSRFNGTLTVAISTRETIKTAISLDGDKCETDFFDLDQLDRLERCFPARVFGAFVDSVKETWEKDETWRAVKQFSSVWFDDIYVNLEERLGAYLKAFISTGIIDKYYHPKGVDASAYYMACLISTRMYLGYLAIEAKEKIIIESFSAAKAEENLECLIVEDPKKPSVFKAFFIDEWTSLLDPDNKNWRNKILGKNLKADTRKHIVSILLSVEEKDRNLFPPNLFPPLKE